MKNNFVCRCWCSSVNIFICLSGSNWYKCTQMHFSHSPGLNSKWAVEWESFCKYIFSPLLSNLDIVIIHSFDNSRREPYLYTHRVGNICNLVYWIFFEVNMNIYFWSVFLLDTLQACGNWIWFRFINYCWCRSRVW